MKPLVSVLLCVYNPDKTELEEAVASIREQSMNEWEMLLYDDGSDREQELYIYEIACQDSRIHYYRSEIQKGLAYGLNEMTKCARGSYIARMDADDISHPERLKSLYDFLEAHEEYAWAGCNAKLIDKDGEVWGYRRMPQLPQKRDFLKFSPYIHPAVMFRTKVLQETGYRNRAGKNRGEDYELFMRLHAEGLQGYNLQEALFYYRETAGGYKKRKLLCQLQEVSIRWKGFHRLQIHDKRLYGYVIKPLMVWLMPNTLILHWKKMRISMGK